MKNEYIDEEKCRKCGGRCCRTLYTIPHLCGFAPWDITIERQHNNYHSRKERYGVEPIFDPLVVHKPGNEHMVKELLSKNIDPYACEYCGKDGCIVPRHKRSLSCRLYNCSPSK